MTSKEMLGLMFTSAIQVEAQGNFSKPSSMLHEGPQLQTGNAFKTL